MPIGSPTVCKVTYEAVDLEAACSQPPSAGRTWKRSDLPNVDVTLSSHASSDFYFGPILVLKVLGENLDWI